MKKKDLHTSIKDGDLEAVSALIAAEKIDLKKPNENKQHQTPLLLALTGNKPTHAHIIRLLRKFGACHLRAQKQSEYTFFYPDILPALQNNDPGIMGANLAALFEPMLQQPLLESSSSGIKGTLKRSGKKLQQFVSSSPRSAPLSPKKSSEPIPVFNPNFATLNSDNFLHSLVSWANHQQWVAYAPPILKTDIVINLKNKIGNTPLHAILFNPNVAAVEIKMLYLLCAGANLLEQNNDGNTVLHLAALKQNQHAYTLLLHWASTQSTFTQLCTQTNHAGKTAAQLWEEQVKTTPPLLSGNLFHWAAAQSDYPIFHTTWLYWVRHWEAQLPDRTLAPRQVQTLLKETNHEGRTPLDIAILSTAQPEQLQEKIKLIQFMLENDADPFNVDLTGQTAFHHALQQDEEDVIDLLHKHLLQDYVNHLRPSNFGKKLCEAKPSQPSIVACALSKQKIDFVIVLINEGITITLAEGNLLHWAELQSQEIFDFVWKKLPAEKRNKYLDEKNEAGFTPLAADNPNTKIEQAIRQGYIIDNAKFAQQQHRDADSDTPPNKSPSGALIVRSTATNASGLLEQTLSPPPFVLPDETTAAAADPPEFITTKNITHPKFSWLVFGLGVTGVLLGLAAIAYAASIFFTAGATLPLFIALKPVLAYTLASFLFIAGAACTTLSGYQVVIQAPEIKKLCYTPTNENDEQEMKQQLVVPA